LELVDILVENPRIEAKIVGAREMADTQVAGDRAPLDGVTQHRIDQRFQHAVAFGCADIRLEIAIVDRANLNRNGVPFALLDHFAESGHAEQGHVRSLKKTQADKLLGFRIIRGRRGRFSGRCNRVTR